MVQGWILLKREGSDTFLTFFDKAFISIFILPLKLGHMFEHKFIFFFLHNSVQVSHSK